MDSLHSKFWHEPELKERAGHFLQANAPVYEVLRTLAEATISSRSKVVQDALYHVVSELQRLPRELLIGAPEARVALDAVSELVRALDNIETSTCRSASETIRQTLGKTEAVLQDLSRCCYQFVLRLSEEHLDGVVSFSLILFRAHDDDGKVLKSYREERGRWMEALVPRERRRVDRHLAVIAPPELYDAVGEIARELGIWEHLPCVVFLGTSWPGELNRRQSWSDQVLHELSTYRLRAHKQGYPKALEEIYSTVYAPGALAAGTRTAAILDKYVARLRIWDWLKFLVGAQLGKGGVLAIETAEGVVKDG